MHVEDRGLIYDATSAPASERVACFTSLCPLASGTMMAGFQVGPQKHAPTSTVRLCRSRDGGRSWEKLPTSFATTFAGKPGSLAAIEMVEAVPGSLLALATWFDRSEPDRPLFDPETEGILRSKQLRAVSTDEGESWTRWREVPTPGLTGTALTGPSVKWSDGTIAVALESFKEFDDPAPARHGAWLLVSRDGGQSFAAPVLVGQDPAGAVYYWDQRLCAASRPGEYVALFWTHDRTPQRDLAVHLRRACLEHDTLQSASIRATTIPGQIAAPCILPDGRLLAFVVDRGRPGTMRLWYSRDGGATWLEQDSLVVYSHQERAALTQGRENIDFAQYWEDMGKWTFGHPAIRPLGEGHVLLAWYAGTPEQMDVHWARVAVGENLPS